MTAEEKTINKIFYLHSVLALESNKHNREVITSRIDKCLKDYHKEASKELVEALKDKKETLIEYQKFLIKNELIGSNAFYNVERFLSEIEPDNEKPYLYFEGEKYYFGEEYEFSDGEKDFCSEIFFGFIPSHEFPFKIDGLREWKCIRKIDHTTKYKKLLLELKEQAEKDGVNLKELI